MSEKSKATQFKKGEVNNPDGRPKQDKYKLKNMVKKIKEYTENTTLPILKECCFENDWSYDYVMKLQLENPQLRQSIMKLLTKKEIALEKGLYSGVNNTGMVFGLKQLGWKDNPEPIIVNNTIQNNVSGNRSEKLSRVNKEIIDQLDDLYDEIERENAENENKEE